MSSYIVRALFCAITFITIQVSVASAEITNKGECAFTIGGSEVKTPFEIIFPSEDRVDLKNITLYNASTFRIPNERNMWPLWYRCQSPVSAGALSQANPGKILLSYFSGRSGPEQREQVQISVPAECGLSEASKTRLIGLSECKTLRNPTQPIRYSDAVVADEKYRTQCMRDGAIVLSAECKGLSDARAEKRPDFKLTCFDYSTARGGPREHQRELMKKMYTSCGLTLGADTPADCGPEGVRRLNGEGQCSCIDQRKRWDESARQCVTLTQEQCTQAGREWSSDTCQNLCRDGSQGLIRTESSGNVVYRCGACPASHTRNASGYCVAQTPDGRERRTPGSACVVEGTRDEGTIAEDGIRCVVVRQRQQCLAGCNEQTHQCIDGRCIARPAVPPPQQPCGNQPCGPGNQQPNGTKLGQGFEKGLTRGLMQQMTPQEQARQQAQQAAEQARQQALQQQQQDPYLMQRLMQMFQPQPFSNIFGSQPVTKAECDSFEINLPETPGGLYRAEKGKPIEVTWSVTDAKRVTVDTTPRSTTRYDRDSDSTAIVTPSRAGTLTIRLKVDSNLYTKEPCRAKKVRVR